MDYWGDLKGDLDANEIRAERKLIGQTNWFDQVSYAATGAALGAFAHWGGNGLLALSIGLCALGVIRAVSKIAEAHHTHNLITERRVRHCEAMLQVIYSNTLHLRH